MAKTVPVLESGFLGPEEVSGTEENLQGLNYHLVVDAKWVCKS